LTFDKERFAESRDNGVYWYAHSFFSGPTVINIQYVIAK